MNIRPHYRTVVLSDIHLGTSHSKVNQVSDFLSAVDCDRLILNGDIIDGWSLQKSGCAEMESRTYAFFQDSDEDDGELGDGDCICEGQSR